MLDRSPSMQQVSSVEDASHPPCRQLACGALTEVLAVEVATGKPKGGGVEDESEKRPTAAGHGPMSSRPLLHSMRIGVTGTAIGSTAARA